MSDTGPQVALPKVAVDAIGLEKQPPQGGDRLAQEDDKAYTLPQLRNRKLEQQIRHIEAEHGARLRLLRSLARLVHGWLVFLASLLTLHGFLGTSEWLPFKISDQVMLAVLGVTTVNVLGVFLVAANYLFPKEPRWMDQVHPESHRTANASRHDQSTS